MKTLVLGDPPPVIASLILERRLGIDTHDEIWDGDYHMSSITASRRSLSSIW